MARQPLIVALAAGLIILLSTVNLLAHRFPETLGFSWYQPKDRIFQEPLVQNAPILNDGATFLLGVGRADITGPVAEINFMGYADAAQVGTGVRQRLYSRAFIVGDTDHAASRFVYLILDTQSGDTAVRHGILEALAALGTEYAVYGQKNVAITGTHSHSGPGAWLNYLLPQITSLGFHRPSYQAIVDGAVASIVQAHEGLSPGTLSLGSINVKDANANRSPYAYLANPEEERNRYEHDVDKDMTLLRFQHLTESGNKDIGILTWFPVHGTSMHANNTLVTGDNKGVAARMFEQAMSDGSFVAGFSQSNVGDTTPNINGAYCESGEQIGEKCDFETSLCGNKTQPCHGRGPFFGRDDAGTSSTFEIGKRQFEAAYTLFSDTHALVPVVDSTVKSVHRFVDLSKYRFTLPNGTAVNTCPAALGHSFAAGTSDGPGAFDFKQGQPDDPHTSVFWTFVRNRLHAPNDTQKACHGVKPILLDVGETTRPYDWTPNIVDLQFFRAGQLFIIVAPGEATTMAGRRWKESVIDSAASTFPEFKDSSTAPIAVLGGPANTYAHYIATPEEYSVQRYEGASTLYGPHTLDAYLDLTSGMIPYLDLDETRLPPLERGPDPPIFTNKSLSFIQPVVVDAPPIFKHFGDVKQDVNPVYQSGETVSARFVGANPRNNLRLGQTFAAVEQYDEPTGTWSRVRDDADWSLVFEWKRTSTPLGTSEVTISWETRWETGAWKAGAGGSPDGHAELLLRSPGLRGVYRLKYYGDAKSIGGTVTAFEGTSSEFRIR